MKPTVSDAGHERKSIPPLSQSRFGDMACETLCVHKHFQGARLGESRLRREGGKRAAASIGLKPCRGLMYPLFDDLRGGFHLRSGSCSGHDFADSPSDQLRTVKMDPVSAVARHQLSPAR